MRYEEILARQPSSTSTDRNEARAYVAFLTTQLEENSDRTLTESQRSYLYKQRAKWQDRADGKDARWNERGSRPGRPSTGKVRRTSYKREEDADPLLAKILRKFETPRRDGDL